MDLPPYALTVVPFVLLAVGAVCVFMSRAGATPPSVKPVRAPSVRFVGEQDGERERALKAALAEFFRADGVVKRAYLARLELGEERTVGLCLKAEPPPDDSYPQRIAELFTRVMGSGGSMDVLFLEPAQETELARVCRAFYDAAV